MPPVEAEVILSSGWFLDRTAALHRPCDTCAPEAEPEPLCDVCRYMRLHHLIICLIHSSHVFYLDLKPENTGDNRVSRIMRTRDCALCRVLSNAMRSYGVLPDQDEYNMCRLVGINGSPLWVMIKNVEIENLEMSGFEIEICYTHVPYETIRGPGSPPGSHPLINHLVHWDWIRGWISHSLKPYRGKNMPRGFRLIDVNNRRLTSEVENSRKLISQGFVALSYVWGNNSASPGNALMQSNKQVLEADGGLGQLPRTIEDAMTICERLGRRYLWVDRYCIQQDEEQEKQRQMDAMADIFSAAEFTIINASGTDMNSPIAGVTEKREVLQSKAVLPGLVLVNTYPDIKEAVDKSKWAKRGWTYQEAVLSKKRLFFTPLEVLFECDETSNTGTSVREDYYANRKHTESWNKRQQHYNDEHRFGSFARHLEEYTGRFLTHQSDILNAFMGICNKLYPNGTSLFGLPESDFDQALLWRKHSLEPNSPTFERERFPSWSWASYTGKVDYPDCSFVATLVFWAYKDRNGKLNAVGSCKRFQPGTNTWYIETAYDTRFHLLLGWLAGFIEAATPDNLMKELEFCSSFNKSHISRRWRTMDKIWDEIKGRRNVGPERFRNLNIGLRAEDQYIINELRPSVLITRTQTSTFKIDLSSGASRICNSEGREVGRLWPDTRNIPKDRATGTELTTSQGKAELMAVSLIKRRTLDSSWYLKQLVQFIHHSIHGGERRQWSEEASNYDQEIKVNVLAIEQPGGSLFWRRVGYGYVDFSQWVSADRTFKTIALE